MSTALALSRKGFTHIEIFERAPAIAEVGAGIQLGPNAVRALGLLGLTSNLEKFSDSAACGYMYEGETDRVLAKLPFSDYALQKYGVPSYQLMRSDLHSLLLSEVLKTSVEFQTGKELVTTCLKGDEVELCFTTVQGEEEHSTADLVVAADGIGSVIANQHYPDYPVSYSGFACWRALVQRDCLDNKWSGSRLNPKLLNSVSVWAGSDKHMVAYPVANSSMLNLVALTAFKDWNSPLRVQKSNKADWLKDYSDWAPDILSIIDKVEDTQLWGLFTRSVLPHWYKDRCLLIGDAAHPMLPSLAQGAAQGIEDAVMLADILSRELPSRSQNKTGLDDLCNEFYKLRHARVERVQRSARWNMNYFHHPKGVYRSIRNTTMRAAGSITTGLIGSRYHWLYRS